MLRFTLNNQIIRRTDDFEPVADSVNYLRAAFSFSEEWQSPKKAIFTANGTAYHVLLENDECVVPWEVIKKPGFTVSVYSGNLITASECFVNVKKSGLRDGTEPELPTPDIWEQYIETAEGHISELSELKSGLISAEKDCISATAEAKNAARAAASAAESILGADERYATKAELYATSRGCNSLSYFFANSYNNDFYGKMDTSGVLFADFIFKQNSMTEISVDLSSCYSAIGGFLSSAAESIVFENGTPKLVKAKNLFSGCDRLVTISGLTLSNVDEVKYMFYSCAALTSDINISSDKVTDISYILYGCEKVTTASINAASVTLAQGAFGGCTALESLTLGGMRVSFDVSETNIRTMKQTDLLLKSLGEAEEGAVITLPHWALVSLITYNEVLNKGWRFNGEIVTN